MELVGNGEDSQWIAVRKHLQSTNRMHVENRRQQCLLKTIIENNDKSESDIDWLGAALTY